MKTFKEFLEDLEEALRPEVVRAAARQQFQRGVIQRQVGNTSPRQVSLGVRLYHGTTQPASQSISNSGWRTDTNVTRQMQGSGVYTTPQKPAAQMYANQRAVERGESPAIRTFKIPSSTFNRVRASRQQSGEWTARKGGNTFNIVQMSPKGANKYDITDTLRGRISVPSQLKPELQQRVSTALSNPRNIAALNRDIRSTRSSRSGSRGGGGTGSSAVSSSSGTGLSRRNWNNYNPGSMTPSGGFGLSNIQLAT